MATKAELEDELAKLRSELSDLKTTARSRPEAPAEDETVPESDSEPKASRDTKADVIDSLREGDIESIVQTFMEELDDLPSRKPLLTALGAFIAGYLIGRSGRKG